MEKHVCNKKYKTNLKNDKKQTKKFENITRKKINNKSNDINKINEIIGCYEIKKED